MSKAQGGPLFRSFFVAARAGSLAFPWCGACERFHWYPMPRCPHCRGAGIEWRPVVGTAKVYSWSVVRHGFDAAWAERLPYIVALLEFADAPGVRLITNLVDIDPEAVEMGMPVTPILPIEDGDDPRVLFRAMGTT